MSGLSRNVVRWLQSLDLTYQIKNPKWDLNNGFLVAEIFSWYYPSEIRMASFNTGQSLDSKMSNWAIIKKFIANNNLDIPVEISDATMHSKEGAGILLLENMFQILTNRQVQKAPSEYDIDLTDWSYQQKLPYYARSTASKSIKVNLRNTEINTDPNLKLNSNKVETIISGHVEHRRLERENNPKRFNVKKTIAEKCIHRPVPIDLRKSCDDEEEESSNNQVENHQKVNHTSYNNDAILSTNSMADDSKQFKEIQVKQENYTFSLGAKSI